MVRGAVVGGTLSVEVVLRTPASAAFSLGMGPPPELHAAKMSPRVKTPSGTATALLHDVCLI